MYVRGYVWLQVFLSEIFQIVSIVWIDVFTVIVYLH